jgi:hypothetical protein
LDDNRETLEQNIICTLAENGCSEKQSMAILEEMLKHIDDYESNRAETLVSQAVSQAVPEPNVLGEHTCDDCRYWKYCYKEIRYWNDEVHRIDAKLKYCSEWKTKHASQL